MVTTYTKVTETGGEQEYEISTPQPASKEIVTLAQLDRDIEMYQADSDRALASKSELEAKKVEILKL